MSFLRRFSSIRLAKQTHTNLPRVVAGELGEDTVFDIICSLRSKYNLPCYSFRALRAPHPRSGYYELDSLLISRHFIIPIEVKHWAGQITVPEEGAWLQTKRFGEQKEFSDPWRKLCSKSISIKQYLKRRKIFLQNKVFVPLVVFTNKSAILDLHDTIPANVMTAEQFQNYLYQLLSFDNTQKGLSLETLGKASVSRSVELPKPEDILAALKRLPTWDTLVFNGGAVLRGDIFEFAIALDDGRLLNRKHVKKIFFDCPSSLAVGLFSKPKAYWFDRLGKQGSGKHQRLLHLNFRRAGGMKVEKIPLENIKELHFGYHKDLVSRKK